MEAHVAGVVLWLAAAVLVGHEGESADDGLDGDVVDLLLEFVYVESLGSQLLEDAGQGTFVPHSHVVAAVVKDEFGIVLVDCVVGQMHILLLEVGSVRLHIRLSRESCQTLVVHVES